ncbi:MAG: 50S ribosomal protein L30 [Deltaproteobacteria bacterium]|jgi:large subunit ribosomal protein L30|nr:50S ribosomal protein L30 [Deltaproteobacteria bacterium]
MTKKTETVIVKQVRSSNRHPKVQLATLKALGLGRIGKTANHVLTPATIGRIKAVSHLVIIEKEK